MASSLKEIAYKCKVSEQSIRAWCRRKQVAKDAKGSFAISESIENEILRHYQADGRKQVAKDAKAKCETCESKCESKNNNETILINMLKSEIENKEHQLAVKDQQIADLNARLSECSTALVAAQQAVQAAQALHAGTIQQQLIEQPREKRHWFRRLFTRKQGV